MIKKLSPPVGGCRRQYNFLQPAFDPPLRSRYGGARQAQADIPYNNKIKACNISVTGLCFK